MKPLFTLVLVVLLASCSKSKFDYKPLAECNFKMTTIAHGTDFKILAYSGGKKCTKDTQYYYQFIGINQTTQDTMRILSACQGYHFGEDPRMVTYSGETINNAKLQDALKKIYEENGINQETKLVAFNNDMPRIGEGNYKTVIGSIGF